MLANDVKQAQIQSTSTKLPHAGMPICALEVRNASLPLRIDIPASAAFVRYKGFSVYVCDLIREEGILLDGPEPVADRKIGAPDSIQCFGELVVRLLGED